MGEQARRLAREAAERDPGNQLAIGEHIRALRDLVDVRGDRATLHSILSDLDSVASQPTTDRRLEATSSDVGTQGAGETTETPQATQTSSQTEGVGDTEQQIAPDGADADTAERATAPAGARRRRRG